MATSGYFLTSDSGRGSAQYYGRMRFEWWRTGWGISGAVGYHNISYHLKTEGGQSIYWQNFYNGSMNVAGAGYSWGTTKAFSAGATVFGDYSNTLYTDSAGNCSFGASAQGGIYTAAINTSGSAGWALDNIPLHSNITGAYGNIDDETPTYFATYTNPAGGAIDVYQDFPDVGIGGKNRKYNYASGGAVPMTTDIDSVRTAMVNTNSTRVQYVIHDTIGGSDYWTWIFATMSIKNNLGQANPTFTNFSYVDNNPTTTNITGDNQVAIQGKSTLQATVNTANKATPNKNANMSSYTFTIGGYSSSSPWASGADVVKSIGTVSDVVGTQNLSVRAIDSRGNSKTVSKSVNILPYASPAFVPQLNVTYTNDYDSASGITVVADGTKLANISPLTLSAVDKNAVNGTSGVRFDLKKGAGSYTGTWVNVATTQTASTGAINGTLATIASAILTKMNGLTADNTVKWTVKFEITDKLETVTYEIPIDIGKAIFRIGTDGKTYNNEETIITRHNKAKATLYSSTTPFTMNWGTIWTSVKVPLDTISSEYDPYGKLTFNSNGIQIGTGISKVLVSGVFGIYNNSNGTDTSPQIYKNSTSLGTFAYFNAPTTYVIYETIPLRSLVVDVTANDIIYMYCNLGGTGNRSIFGFTTLSVEVIE